MPMMEHVIDEVGIDINEVVDVGHDAGYGQGGPLLRLLSPYHVGTPPHYIIEVPSPEGLGWLLDRGQARQ